MLCMLICFLYLLLFDVKTRKVGAVAGCLCWQVSLSYAACQSSSVLDIKDIFFLQHAFRHVWIRVELQVAFAGIWSLGSC